MDLKGELIGTWDETEASMQKQAKGDYPTFVYDNSTAGGILESMSTFFQTIKKIENTGNTVIANINRLKELYTEFGEVLPTLDSICGNLTNNIQAIKNCNENIIKNLELAVAEAMKKDAAFAEDLGILNQLMSEEGINPTVDISAQNASSDPAPQVEQPVEGSSQSTYTVSSGDTLSKIAAAHGTTVAAIAAANGLKDINKIGVGQQLIIPNGSETPSQTSTAESPSVEEQIMQSEDVNAFKMDNSTSNGNIDTSKYNNNENRGFVVTTGNQTYTNMSSKDKELLTAIICAECDGSYDDALAVASVILNRTESPQWSWCGNSPVKQATAPSQFVVYENNRYQKYMGSGVNPVVQEAVNDALNGVRNNNYYSFRSNGSTGYSSNMITSSGNRYK